MQIKFKLLLVLLALQFSYVSNTYGQNSTDSEIKRICNKITDKINTNTKIQIKNLAISDFTDLSLGATNLGKYLAEELTFHLSEENLKDLTLIDRSMLKELLEEEEITATELIDPGTAIQLGMLKGIDSLLYGTIDDVGESYRLYIKAIHLETGTVLGIVRATLMKTPSLTKKSY